MILRNQNIKSCIVSASVPIVMSYSIKLTVGQYLKGGGSKNFSSIVNACIFGSTICYSCFSYSITDVIKVLNVSSSFGTVGFTYFDILFVIEFFILLVRADPLLPTSDVGF